jgi:hypothetical protein
MRTILNRCSCPRVIWTLVVLLAAAVGASLGVGLQPSPSYGVNNTVLSSITPYFGTSTISTVWTWHGANYGEDALDLFVPQGADGYFAGYVANQYLYWESSNYGSEGGGTSACTGKVYKIWWSQRRSLDSGTFAEHCTSPTWKGGEYLRFRQPVRTDCFLGRPRRKHTELRLRRLPLP